MKIFILLIFLNPWGLDGDSNCWYQKTIKKMVKSPEHAAMLLWQHNSDNPYDIGKLYEIQLDRETVEEVPIPGISFHWKVLNEYSIMPTPKVEKEAHQEPEQYDLDQSSISKDFLYDFYDFEAEYYIWDWSDDCELKSE